MPADISGSSSASRPKRSPANLRVSAQEDGAVIALSGELDVATAPILSQALDPAIERGGVVTLDVRELAFMDSSGLRLLLEGARRLEGRGKIVLRSPTRPVGRLLEISGVLGRTSAFEVEGGSP